MVTETKQKALVDPEIMALIEQKYVPLDGHPTSGPTLDELMMLTAFAKRYPDLFTPQQLRWMHFDANNSGWAEHGVSFKIGRRVLINVPAFRQWMLSHRKN